MSDLETLEEHASFGGTTGFYSHDSEACGGPMRFAVYQPPQAKEGPVPVVFFLSGLTCTAVTSSSCPDRMCSRLPVSTEYTRTFEPQHTNATSPAASNAAGARESACATGKQSSG